MTRVLYSRNNASIYSTDFKNQQTVWWIHV